MNKKKVKLISLSLILILSIFLTWYYGEPKEFPNDQTIVSKMNANIHGARPKEILDQLFLDRKHVYVPFITEDGSYGSSYWVWKNRSWQMAEISNRGEPFLWKINKKDPSTHFLVWNMDPNDTVKEIDFYLIKDRNYLISEGVHTYEPKLQMKERVSISENSYGYLKTPEKWATFIDSYNKVKTARTNDLFFDDFMHYQSYYIGWHPLDHKGKETFPNLSINGNSYVYMNQTIEHVRIMNEYELE